MAAARRHITRFGPVLLLPLLFACGDSTGPDMPLATDIVMVTAGDDHACVLDAAGDAWCWGSGGFGQLGIGDTLDHTTPQPVTGGLHFASLTGGSAHTCGLLATHEAYCWGANATGAVGDGSSLLRSLAPVPVSGGHRFSQLSAGTGFTCGIDLQGHPWCWGSGLQGELGDGKAADEPVAAAVAGGLTLKSITTGLFHTCGLTATGQAWCWGNNLYGQLGTGDLNPRSVPVPIGGTRRFLAIGAGSFHTCALGEDHRAYCWGSNISFELGNGSNSTTYALEPTTVATSLTFSGIAVGAYHACAWTGAGDLYCWGANTYGKLGYGSEVATVRPVAVVGGHAFRLAAAGSNHTCGLTTAREAVCWGWNRFGQLGNGSRSNSLEPVAIDVAGFDQMP